MPRGIFDSDITSKGGASLRDDIDVSEILIVFHGLVGSILILDFGELNLSLNKLFKLLISLILLNSLICSISSSASFNCSSKSLYSFKYSKSESELTILI